MKSLLAKIGLVSREEVAVQAGSSSNPDFSEKKEEEVESSYEEFVNRQSRGTSRDQVAVSISEN